LILVSGHKTLCAGNQHRVSGMVVFPHCKINLGLQVVSKRSDGYHNIETCFYPVLWTDILEIIKAETFAFSCSGISIPGKEDDNLCIKAYQLLRNDFGLSPVHIHLHKVIPTGAGLGGGSSNAAFALRTLNSIFDLKLSVQQLRDYAIRLGSDCSFFIGDKPMLGTGRGEELSPVSVNLKGLFLVLVKPQLHISTADAYSGIKPKQPAVSLTEILALPVTEWKNSLVNDFEESVFKKHPAISSLRESLYQNGAIYASMSGSGASVFGIFNSPVNLFKEFEGMTYWAGVLN
jgi:4-diphosphocytidyl-2-C-methyl-D-erythritol kinase